MRLSRYLRWLPGLATGCLLAAVALAASTPAHQTGVELTPSTQQSLRQISEGAIQWNKAFLQDDREVAGRELSAVLSAVERMGMRTLADLSLSAVSLAVSAAEEGDFARAGWALEAAEQLDPGRPEIRFASALVNRLKGSYVASLVDSVQGYRRLLRYPQERGMFAANLALWVLVSLALASALFLLLLIAVKGKAVIFDLVELLGRLMPAWLAVALVAGILVLPLLLPRGLFWMLLVWSLILWGYGSVQERLVLIAIWLFAGCLPLALQELGERVDVVSSPAYRGIHNLAIGRLYGRLFTDVGALEAVLPRSVAVQQMKADLHARLGQWDQARSLYNEVLEEEPDNSATLNNLGVYFFVHGDNGGAAQRFERASSSDPENATAFFNLSQAYNAAYLYQDARVALGEAQRLDSEAVGRWIRENDDVPVRLVQGSLARIPEIESQLREAGGRSEEAAVSPRLRLVRLGLSLVVAVGLTLMAVTLHFARRGFGYRSTGLSLGRRGSGLAMLLKVLVPGLESASEGRGIAAFVATVPLVALAALPFARYWGVRIPWGFDPGGALVWVVVTLGLVSLLLMRLLRYRSLEA